MVATSTNGKGPNVALYNEIAAGIKKGDFTPLVRFILAQRNFELGSGLADMRVRHSSGAPERSVEDLLNKEQSENLIKIYITAARLLGDWADRGNYANLNDTRTAAIMAHRGWYLSDYILPTLMRRARPDFDKKYPDDKQLLRAFYMGFETQSTPEFDVVQSILTDKDLAKYIKIFKEQKFVHPNTTPASYYADAQKVFHNILNGRSVVLLTVNTIQQLNEFLQIFGDKNSPYHKPEYNDVIKAAVDLVRNQWAAEQQRVKATTSRTRPAPQPQPAKQSADAAQTRQKLQKAAAQYQKKQAAQEAARAAARAETEAKFKDAAQKYQDRQQARKQQAADAETPTWLRKLKNWLRD